MKGLFFHSHTTEIIALIYVNPEKEDTYSEGISVANWAPIKKKKKNNKA